MIMRTVLLANAGSTNYQTDLPKVNAGSVQLHTILSLLLGILGALCVLMIVIGGLRYITSQGSPQETGKAKATIAYALVGLLIVLTAESLVALALNHI